MKYIDKNKDLKGYTLNHESIVLKLDNKAKELLGYFFDALNYIYSEITKNNNIQNINFFLLSLKPKIDSIINGPRGLAIILEKIARCRALRERAHTQ